MARFRRRARSSGRSARGISRRRGRSRGSSKDGSLMYKIGGAMVYGAARQKIYSATAPYINKVSNASYALPIGVGLLAYGVGKWMPALKPVTNAALTIEAATLGAGLASGMLSNGGTATSGSGVQVYG